MHISSTGLKLIKEFEGCYLRAYDDGGGTWTIGYGHVEGVHPGDRLPSEQAASDLLDSDMRRKYEPPVNRAMDRYGVRLNQGQFDATVSLTYNLGSGILDPSHTFGARLKARDLKGARDAIWLYRMPGTKFEAGLGRRRRAEQALWDHGESKRDRLEAELKRIRSKAREHGWGPKSSYLRRRAGSIKKWLGDHEAR